MYTAYKWHLKQLHLSHKQNMLHVLATFYEFSTPGKALVVHKLLGSQDSVYNSSTAWLPVMYTAYGQLLKHLHPYANSTYNEEWGARSLQATGFSSQHRHIHMLPVMHGRRDGENTDCMRH